MIQLLKQCILSFGYCLFVSWWFIRRPQTRGAKCVILHDINVLLVRPAYGHKLWTIPGGGVHKHETFLEGALRELKEETGVETGLTYFYAYRQSREFKHDTVQCFYGQVDDATVVVDNFEIIDYQWFSLESLPDDRSSSVSKILAALPRA